MKRQCKVQEKHPLTCLGFHADPFWEDAKDDRPSVGAQCADLGEGGVFVASLNDKDNWKREEVGHEIQQCETHTTSASRRMAASNRTRR